MAGTRIVWGYVDGRTGKPYSGTGFRVVKRGTGWYSVVLDRAFPVKPAATVMQVFTNESGDPGSTLDNATGVAINTDSVEFETGDAGGGRKDRDFAFSIMGPE
jgi:hypothetical protein